MHVQFILPEEAPPSRFKGRYVDLGVDSSQVYLGTFTVLETGYKTATWRGGKGDNGRKTVSYSFVYDVSDNTDFKQTSFMYVSHGSEKL